MKGSADVPKANKAIAVVCSIGIILNVVSGNFDMMTNSLLFLGLMLLVPFEANLEKPEKDAD